MAWQAGEVHLDGEMERPALRQVLQQIGHLERRAAGVERQALGDPQRNAPGVSVAGKLDLDAVGVAADAGFVGAVDEIAPLRRRAVGHCLQRRVVVVEQVHQAFARVVVVLQPPVQVGLLEDHALVDAGHLVVLLVLAGPHLFMVRLGPAVERGQEVVLDAADVQLGHLPAAAGRTARPSAGRWSGGPLGGRRS